MLSKQVQRLFVHIFITSLTLVCIGIVMIASSSMADADYGHGSMHHYAVLHLLRILLGLLGAVFIYRLSMQSLQYCSPLLMAVGLGLSLMLFVPGFSVSANGATRWLRIGSIVFQPYDLFKLGYLLFLAYALERYHRVQATRELKIAMGVLLLTAVLLLLQPDFGSFFLLGGVMVLVFFLLFGWNRYLLGAIPVIGAIIAWLVISEPYRLQRVMIFFDPWVDRYGLGFQLIQAMIAEGNGGLLGVGLGKSVQKMLYLPEAHTDFTISVFAEELGLFGVMVVLGFIVYLYLLMSKLVEILRQVDMLFESYLVFMIAHFMLMQSLINIGVNYGLLPTKGITLPFLSYGGTSIISHIVMIGMVMSVCRHLKNHFSGQAHYHDTCVSVVKA